MNKAIKIARNYKITKYNEALSNRQAAYKKHLDQGIYEKVEKLVPSILNKTSKPQSTLAIMDKLRA